MSNFIMVEHKNLFVFSTTVKLGRCGTRNIVSGGSLCWTSLLRLTSKMITKRRETIGSISKLSWRRRITNWLVLLTSWSCKPKMENNDWQICWMEKGLFYWQKQYPISRQWDFLIGLPTATTPLMGRVRKSLSTLWKQSSENNRARKFKMSATDTCLSLWRIVWLCRTNPN